MKFRGVKNLVLLAAQSAINEIQLALQDLFVGINRLNFEDNFDSFTWTGPVEAGTEVTIPNKLSSIPTKYLVVRNNFGEPIGDGIKPWTSDFVYLKNYGGGNATITVVFMR